MLRQVAHAKIMGCASLVPGNAGSLAPRKQLRRGAITAKFISAKNVRDKKKPQRPSKNPHRAKVILPPVGLDVGFAVLPALRAAIRQGRVAWGLLMVSSGAMQTGLPSVNYRSRGLIIPSAALA